MSFSNIDIIISDVFDANEDEIYKFFENMVGKVESVKISQKKDSEGNRKTQALIKFRFWVDYEYTRNLQKELRENGKYIINYNNTAKWSVKKHRK